MTEPARTPLSLPARVGVVNVGLPLFGDAIAEQGAPVLSVDWRVPAGGQPAAVAALGRLYGIHAERIETANAEVLRRLDRGIPVLTGMTTVAEAAPGLPAATLLHCGPAIGYADAPDPLRRSMRAAVVAEGWAASAEQADELLLMGLRLREGVDLARHAALAGRALDGGRIAALAAQGLVETREGRLRATTAGFAVLDAIVADLAA